MLWPAWSVCATSTLVEVCAVVSELQPVPARAGAAARPKTKATTLRVLIIAGFLCDLNVS